MRVGSLYSWVLAQEDLQVHTEHIVSISHTMIMISYLDDVGGPKKQRTCCKCCLQMMRLQL